MPVAKTFNRYGYDWPASMDALEIEFQMIRLGGYVKLPNGVGGHGLYHHFKCAMHLCWPEDDWHRWADLALKEELKHRIVGIMGPQNSNKTYSSAKFALIMYWCFPSDTLVMISSTDVRGLELRVWGKIKELFNRAIENYPWLPGKILESVHAVTTESGKGLDDGEDRATNKRKGRVLHRGIICIPCLQGGRYVGLKNYVGVKQNRIMLIADEAQLMGQSFLDSIANLSGNRGSKTGTRVLNGFRAIIMGNPLDITDPLGMACEPVDGWDSQMEPTKTTVWKTKFLDGVCINFVGSDSPNFDHDQTAGPKYPYLQNKAQLDNIASFWGKDSHQWYSQGLGVMKTGLVSRRIITRQLCQEHKALQKATWKDTKRTKIYAVDAAYGGVGGDRCVGGWCEFGESPEGEILFRVNPPVIIPVSIKRQKSPEDQIAEYVFEALQAENIPAENAFYDSTGRGTLGPAFARLFGMSTPRPVEFGGKPTQRPVRHDLFTVDTSTRQKRHQRCDEYYFDFVSELWFSVRYCIESEQLRELPEEVMAEGCKREYGRTKNNKLFIESKHDPKARERMGRSPDLFDWLVTCLEGARQRGFQIAKLGAELVDAKNEDSYKWLEKLVKQRYSLLKSKQLTYANTQR